MGIAPVFDDDVVPEAAPDAGGVVEPDALGLDVPAAGVVGVTLDDGDAGAAPPCGVDPGAGAGEPAGAEDPAGDVGVAPGITAPPGGGVGVVPRSSTLVPPVGFASPRKPSDCVPKYANASVATKNIVAATAVERDRKFALPVAPNKLPEEPLPKDAPMSAPLPCWISTRPMTASADSS